MRALTQRQGTGPSQSTGVAWSGPVFSGKSSETSPSLTPALDRMPRSPATRSGESPGTRASAPRLAHDFSRISIHPDPRFTLRPKLQVNPVGDPFEQEADRVAEHVMRTPEPQPQRTPAHGGTCTECQNRETNADHLHAKRRAGNAEPGVAAPPAMPRLLSSPGHPLDAVTRAFMEPRFGQDFSKVRVHTDAQAADSAKDIDALAYTVGEQIVFGVGEYAPSTTKGKRLLAHELTHVVQQRTAPAPTDEPGDRNRRDAEAGAGRLLPTTPGTDARTPVFQRAARPAIMRKADFSSSLQICHTLLKSRVFTVSQGGLIAALDTRWAGPEEGAASCETHKTAPYHVTLVKRGYLFNDQYGTCAFQPQQLSTRVWKGLPEGEYHLEIWTNNTNPNCCLEGTIEVSEQAGLTGDSCTELPDDALTILHTALAIAGLVPVLGAVPDAIDAGIYSIQGDWTNAGISAAAMVPIFGEGATVVKLGLKTVVKVSGKTVKKIGKEGLATAIKEVKAAKGAAAVAKIIPQGFTEAAFKKFSKGARRLRKEAGLPASGELVVHGSRVKGTATAASDIDVALRVDEATFFELAEKCLARTYPETKLRKTMLERIRKNGQLSSFDLGTQFSQLRREFLDAASPVETVQFSVLKKGGKLDTGPFLPLE